MKKIIAMILLAGCITIQAQKREAIYDEDKVPVFTIPSFDLLLSFGSLLFCWPIVISHVADDYRPANGMGKDYHCYHRVLQLRVTNLRD